MTKTTPKEIVNYWADYQKFAPTLIADWLEKEKDYLRTHIPKDACVLDVGCGFGGDLEILNNGSRRLIGIDHQPEMVKLAIEKLSIYPEVIVSLQDATDLKFPDKSFDYAICMGNTFGNFGDKKLKALQEMKRVVRENGTILIGVYSENALEYRLAGYRSINLPISRIKNSSVYTSNGIVSEQFTSQQLEKLLSQAGLPWIIKRLNPISYIVEARK